MEEIGVSLHRGSLEGERLTEPPKQSFQDPLHGILILALVASVALSIIGTLGDEFRSVTGAASLILLKPLVRLTEEFKILLDVPVLGSMLFHPSVQCCQSYTILPLPSFHWQGWLELQWIAGRAALFFFAVPMLIAAYLLRWRRRPDLKFRMTHSFDSLIQRQGQSWPMSRLVRMFAPLAERTPPAETIVAMRDEREIPLKSQLLRSAKPAILPPSMEIALRPETWLLSEGLGRWPRRGQEMVSPGYPYVSMGAVCEAMEEQMGPLWSGTYVDLRPSLRGLAAAFALGMAAEAKDCEKLLTNLSGLAELSLPKESLDRVLFAEGKRLKQINAILKGTLGLRLLRQASHHAWQRTALASMFECARAGMGVLPSAWFVWLKHQDRTLWYLLNALGNDVAAAEAAGLLAHFRAEQQAQQPLWAPMIGLGARALVNDYLGLDPESGAEIQWARTERQSVGQRLRAAAETTKLC